ncbi:MAG: hypothetical protein WEF50_21610 [Myxococcota bacterium]
MRLRGFVVSIAALAALALPSSALAAFHLVEIEQVIGGVDGDTSAQAVQLRMRTAGQNLFSGAVRLRAWDAAGTNPVVLIAFSGANPASGVACRRILVATPDFEFTTTPPLDAAAADYVMNTPIPASYLAAGSLTFENTAGTQIYWRLSWGGASYTGPGTVTTIAAGGNDADGTMNPPFAGPLPSTGLEAVRFTPACATAPTTNLAHYALTVGAATFTANDLDAFVVTAGPEPVPIFPGAAGLALVGGLGALAVGSAFLRRRAG